MSERRAIVRLDGQDLRTLTEVLTAHEQSGAECPCGEDADGKDRTPTPACGAAGTLWRRAATSQWCLHGRAPEAAGACHARCASRDRR